MGVVTDLLSQTISSINTMKESHTIVVKDLKTFKLPIDNSKEWQQIMLTYDNYSDVVNDYDIFTYTNGEYFRFTEPTGDSWREIVFCKRNI